MKPRAPAGQTGVIAGHCHLELWCGAATLCDRERAIRTRGEKAAEDRISAFDVRTVDPDLWLGEAQQRERAREHDPNAHSVGAGTNEPVHGALELFPVPPSEVGCAFSGGGDELPAQLDALDGLSTACGFVPVTQASEIIGEKSRR